MWWGNQGMLLIAGKACSYLYSWSLKFFNFVTSTLFAPKSAYPKTMVSSIKTIMLGISKESPPYVVEKYHWPAWFLLVIPKSRWWHIIFSLLWCRYWMLTHELIVVAYWNFSIPQKCLGFNWCVTQIPGFWNTGSIVLCPIITRDVF